MKQFMEKVKCVILKIPILGGISSRLYKKYAAIQFKSSEHYWMNRYAKGGNSGAGSYNKLAEFKAEILNEFVGQHKIKTVIEYGCGDGNQLGLANYENYLGFDVSPEAIEICRKIFCDDKTKEFKLMKEYAGERTALALSLDVIYHLVEDNIFRSYMERLFSSADEYVIIYSSNKNEQDKDQPPHVRQRKFTSWIEDNIDSWELVQHVPNRYPHKEDRWSGSFADFYIYKRNSSN